MQIYWNKRKRLHKKRVQLPEDWFGTPTWPPFHCFGTPIWPPWRHVKTLYCFFAVFRCLRRRRCINSLMFDACEQVVLVLCRWRSFPENREWSSRVVVIPLFATKSIHEACFTDTKQTWFALSDETPAYAVTLAKFHPIRIQCLRKLLLYWSVERQVWT